MIIYIIYFLYPSARAFRFRFLASNLGLDLLSLQCFLPATLNLNLFSCLTKSLFLQSARSLFQQYLMRFNRGFQVSVFWVQACHVFLEAFSKPEMFEVIDNETSCTSLHFEKQKRK